MGVGLIVILGKQGAGKGTQCARLADRYGVPHVATGDILRAAVKSDSPLGREVKNVMRRGAPGLRRAHHRGRRRAPGPARRGGRGDPRRLPAHRTPRPTALEAIVGADGIAACIVLAVPTEVVIARLSARRVCSDCGAIYSADPGPAPEHCTNCGGTVVQRADDAPTPSPSASRSTSRTRSRDRALRRQGQLSPDRRATAPRRGVRPADRGDRPDQRLNCGGTPRSSARCGSRAGWSPRCTRRRVPRSRRGSPRRTLNEVAAEVIERRGARSNFLNYHGFPAVICTSPNSMIVHGIPGGYVLREGDIISVDCGAIVEGYHGDAAYTAGVGEISKLAQRPHRGDRGGASTRASTSCARATTSTTSAARSSAWPRPPGSPSCASTWATRSAPPCTRSPQVPNYWPGTPGPTLKPGMVFADRAHGERGGPRDRGAGGRAGPSSPRTAPLSAHFEHTIAITDDGPEIFTIAG